MISTAAFFVLSGALLIQIIQFFRSSFFTEKVPAVLYGFSGLLLLTEIIRRSVLIRFPAITGIYEGLMFFTAGILLVISVYSFQSRLRCIPLISFGAGCISLGALALMSSPLIPAGIRPPVPALQSAWLILHVTLSFIGEAFFALGFFSSLYYFITKDKSRKKSADRITAAAVSTGYPIFTLGALIFGAVWAQAAWGSYWSWDPKETWALITWLVYTAYLHARFVGKKKGSITAVLSIAGFLLALFTFLGVNYLLPGLHSYR